ADRFRNLVRFPEAHTDRTIMISSNDQGAEAKTAAAFHHFGAPIDEHHLLGRVTFGRRAPVDIA
ncbi:MAG: hypothetical protein JWO45_1645, partial [Spartobacteria bacterium]|nr:hypothetical protein [Spartobacteria bacterium]